jgi:anti-anti-sigma factor
MTSAGAPPSPARSWSYSGSFHAVVYPDAHVALAGELDVGALDALRAALDQVLLEPDEVVEIDAAQLSFIDSTAISELLRYHVIAAAEQRWLHLERVSWPVGNVLDILDLRHILMDEPRFTPVSSEDAASCSP